MRVLIVFVLGLILYGAPLAAQSATTLAGWVLWQRSQTSEAKPATPLVHSAVTWNPEEGFERLAECRTAAIASARSLKTLEGMATPPSKVQVEVTNTEAMIITTTITPQQKSASFVTARYMCLPGSLDPRPRGLAGQ